MKVFISWSGETSKNIAEIIRQWLPSVIQSVKPYYSPDDITKGTRWSTEIGKELDESRIGIICLTKDNLKSSWIMFEAGALSKNIGTAKVCPILFGIDPADIEGPLVQFQAAKFSKDEVKKVVRMINSELGETALSTEVFENVFEMWWPKLSEKIEGELKKPVKGEDKDIRDQRDILEEILALTRTISITRDKLNREGRINPAAIEDLVFGFNQLVNDIVKNDMSDCHERLMKLFRPIEYIINRSDLNRGMTNEFRAKMEETLTMIHDLQFVQTPKSAKNERVFIPKLTELKSEERK